jgi:hypothetical protein
MGDMTNNDPNYRMGGMMTSRNSMTEGTFVYACPMPSTPDSYIPWVNPYPSTASTTLYYGTLPTEVQEQLDRIEQKLDELLARSAPEASVVEDIRKRVNDALDAVKGKKRGK